jgi:phosphoribosyl 1,2-cyclic phosphodiesterase
MQVTFYGTRGSCPVSHPSKAVYGGNTTCLRIESSCLPKGHWLLIDAGTGIVPLSADFVRDGGQAVTILQTHYHHDHTQGFVLSTFPYLKDIPVTIYGPTDQGLGPRSVYQTLMHSPYFPVDLREVGSHINCIDITNPNSTALVIHAEGGQNLLTVESLERLAAEGTPVSFPNGTHFKLAECLVITMHRSHHPERTISYRFEERPSGQTFAFLTDHENQDGIPTRLATHLQKADLLVMDTQYTREKYEEMTAGWGHATPDYSARVAKRVGPKALGLTHHDPASSDVQVDEIVEIARTTLAGDGVTIPVFGCRDYMAVDIGDVPGALSSIASKSPNSP